MTVSSYFIAALVILCFVPSVGRTAFGGQPPLGPKDNLRRLFAPYDLVKLNYLGMNYCENLLDLRTNITAYTHLNCDSNSADAWHLQFPDDSARLLEGIAWEDEYSPVVRLELARRLVKGIIAAHYPGTRAYYSFRIRVGGKTSLIFDDSGSGKQGRLMVSNWGDSIEGQLKVGFRVQKDGKWLEIDQFNYEDDPKNAGSPGVARNSRYWNESPYVFKRAYTCDQASIDFTGRYWMSDEDMPLEFGFASKDADKLDIVVGEPGKHMPLLRDSNAPGYIHLPDRKTVYSSERDRDIALDYPDFKYMLLRKQTAWACPGYSTGLLVMWEGKPEKVEALAENGYGVIRVSYPKTGNTAEGKVWLLPFQWINDSDMDYVFRNAEHFLKTGKLMHNGLPTQQLVNAIPAGLAAGAYLLTRYNDPFAFTAQVHAQNAVDAIFDGEKQNKKIVRIFFPVRAAAWMIKLAKELGDKEMAAKYERHLDSVMKRMLSPEAGYDGRGWAGGWDHFNALKAAWIAYDATGNREYLGAYKRALQAFTIDENGIYRDGKPMDAPGGFDTYFGSMPLGAWGHSGKVDWVNTLINLDVPNNQHDPKRKLSEMWNDAGAGPWAQDDANPEYVGFSLKGAAIPQKEKYILPVDSFPVYQADGTVQVTRQPILDNPFFPKAADELRIQKAEDRRSVHDVKRTEVTLSNSNIYKLKTKKASGAAIDLLIKGDGYTVDVSPDGKRWYRRLDTWSDEPRWQSVDLSYLCGGKDEMLKIINIDPLKDSNYLISQKDSGIEREHCRYVKSGGELVYKLDLPQVSQCYVELLVGNGYRIECSDDGKTWHKELAWNDIEAGRIEDAAWLRIFDASKCVQKSGVVYVRITSEPGVQVFGDSDAFIRRLTVYGVFDSDEVYVKVSNVSSDKPFTLQKAVFRSW